MAINAVIEQATAVSASVSAIWTPVSLNCPMLTFDVVMMGGHYLQVLKRALPTTRSHIEAHTMSSSRRFGLPSTSSAHPEGSNQPPPAYTEYPTELPTTFPIGKHEVPPLVNVTDLQAHLRLLGAFDRLKYTVQHPDDRLPVGMQREHLWILFLNRAVQRFEAFMSATWPNNVVVASTEATMPPLDVLMVWHTYLLV